MQWEKKYRGGTDVYGGIYTKRWNYWVLMNFLLQKKMLFSFSYTDHDQNSIYGYAIPREATHWLWAIDLG
jgi:outer membrane receptor for ferrienterochelin and colicins